MQHNITYRQKDKGWQFIISYKDNNGKWKQKSKQGFNKRGDAKKASDLALDELKETLTLQESLATEYAGITFKEFVDMHIESSSIYVERNTSILYNTLVKKFSKLDDIPLKDITTLHIQECINDMVKEGLNTSTIQGYTSKLRTMLNSAIKPYKIILTNPVDSDIRIPESKKDEKIKALNKLELDDLLKRIKPEKDYMIALIAATCGLRLGEILGLTWNDIDLKKSTLSVNKQWKKLKDNTYGFGDTKTKNSNRVVPIPPKTLTELKKYKISNISNITDMNNRIFIDKHTGTVSGRFFDKLKRLGYDITIHDLRHTYATMLIANGVDFKTVAKFLGHDVDMTMKIYSHVNQDMINMATDKINIIF